MARFLFCVVPALGHLNPSLPIACELKKRGHRVAYATGADVRSAVECEGLEFFPAGLSGMQSHSSPALEKMLQHTGLRGNYYFYKALVENAAAGLRDLPAVIETFDADVIVADAITHAGAQMAEVYRLPWATSHPLPGLIPSRDAPPFTSWGLPPSRNPLVQAAYGVVRLGQGGFFRLFDRDFNALRVSAGLPPLRHCAVTGTLSPYLILIPTCEGFEYRRSDWPAQAHLIGPAPWGKTGDAAVCEWIERLPPDRPLVYVTLGTVQVLRSLDFFTIVMQALGDEDCQVVMSVGPAIDRNAFARVPDNCRLERFVPHAQILPRCAAVIHHGGQGIAQDCIYHGLPSVVVPISHDLYEVARRCSSAGVAVTIPYPRLTAERLKAAVHKIRRDREILANTRALQSVFLKTSAGATGATLLEQLAETRQPVLRACSPAHNAHECRPHIREGHYDA